LRTIIDRQIGGMSQRINVTGCDIFIIPSAAQQFAMIIHELMTNALKYGSLSTPNGSVAIEGKINRGDEDRSFFFTWKEVGGPTVSAPNRKGFGSVILLDSAKHFAENVSADYLPRGLIYSLRIRLGTIEAKPTGRELTQDIDQPPSGEQNSRDRVSNVAPGAATGGTDALSSVE